jgi:hypothetical protein
VRGHARCAGRSVDVARLLRRRGGRPGAHGDADAGHGAAASATAAAATISFLLTCRNPAQTFNGVSFHWIVYMFFDGAMHCLSDAAPGIGMIEFWVAKNISSPQDPRTD